jgi:predicted Zn-dependent protease
MDRVEGLNEILKLNPKDSFARYGLAVELSKRGELAGAIAQFDLLLENDPGYISGYNMAAQTLAAAGRAEEAVARLKAGVERARAAGDAHAASNMQSLLDELDR